MNSKRKKDGVVFHSFFKSYVAGKQEIESSTVEKRNY